MSGEEGGRQTPRILWAAAILIALLIVTGVTDDVLGDGNQTPDIVWRGNHLVTSDVHVGPGETLLIEPGSIVIFTKGATLNVEGTLTAVGSPGAPIIIDGGLQQVAQDPEDNSSPYIMSPTSSMVFIGGSSDASVLDNVMFSSMTVVIDGSSMRMTNSTMLDNSRVSVSGSCSPSIVSNQFVNNGVGEPSIPWYRVPYEDWRQKVLYGSTLICSDGTSALIENNTFFRNGGFGLEVEDAHPRILGNTFELNRLGGIRIESTEGGDTPVLVQGNVINNHGIFEDGHPLVEDPSGPLDGPVGILLSNTRAHLVDNLIVDNEVGIVCIVGNGPAPELRNEELRGNNVGIYTDSGSLTVQDSSLSSWGYDIWVTGVEPVKLVNTTLDEGKVRVEGDEVPDAVPRSGFPYTGAIILVAFGVAVSAGSTEVGRKGLFAAAYPLYARARKEKVLDQFLRGQIYGLIRGRPGIHYSRIRRTLEVGNGVLAYHLNVLEKEGFIRPKRLGTRLLYYPTKLPFALQDVEERFPLGEEPVSGIALSEVQERVVALIKDRPGISQSEIARALGMSKQRVSYHMRNLVLAEVITVIWDSNRTRCYPRDWDPQDDGSDDDAVPEGVESHEA